MIGRVIAGRFHIESEIGRGGRGVVYRAVDQHLERTVAVKCLRAELHGEDDSFARFRREALTVARLDHPGIVPVYDFGRHGEAVFLVMALAPGQNLRQWMADRQLTPLQLVEILLPIVDALAYSHEQGIIHRDIKPENIMVERRRELWRSRLLDFGIALDGTRQRLTLSTGLIGTPHYLSPEQLTDDPIDRRSDLYSLGAVLYEALAGRPPHEGSLATVLRKTLVETPPTPSELGIDLPEALEGLIVRCLAKSPDERPDDADELGASLRRLLGDARPRRRQSRQDTPRPPEPGPTAGRHRELRRLVNRLDRAIGGRCQLAILTGEPGIGKTTLLDALAHRAEDRGLRVLRGRFVERTERSFPYHGFFEVLLQYFRTTHRDVESGGPRFSDLAETLVRLFPALADVPELRRRAGWSLSGFSGWLGGRSRIFETLAKALGRIADQRPLVLLLEDLHEADVSIDALRYLIRRLGPLPIVFAVSCRAPVPPTHRGLRDLLVQAELDADCCCVVRLGPLGRRTIEEIAARRLPAASSLTNIAGEIHAMSGGHPLFATELISALDEDCEHLDSGGELCLDRLPPSVHQALDRRLDLLDDAARQAAQMAAVLGQAFEVDDLRALVGGSPDQRLRGLGLTRPDTAERHVFKSRLLRERIYERLSPRERRQAHRRVLHHLQPGLAEDPDRVVFAIAHHANRAGEIELAIDTSLRAARLSLDAGSPEDTIDLASRVLELLGPDGSRRGRLEATALLAQGHVEARRDTDALRIVQRAFDTFGTRPETAVLALLAARAAWRRGDVDAAFAWIDRGRAGAGPALRHRLDGLAREIDERLHERSPAGLDRPRRSPERLGELLLIQGDYLAARELFETARARDAESDATAAAMHRLHLAELATKLGEYREAIEQCRLAAIGAPPQIAARADALAARTLCATGALDEAAARAESGFQRLAEITDADIRNGTEARLMRAQGNIDFASGRPARALARYRQSIERLDPTDDRWERSIALFNIAESLIALGDLERASEHLDEAHVAKSVIGDRWGLAYVYWSRAQIRRRRGELDAAERDARLGLEIAERLGDPQIGTRLQVELGQIRADQDHPVGARRHLIRGLRLAENARLGHEARHARAALADLEDREPRKDSATAR